MSPLISGTALPPGVAGSGRMSPASPDRLTEALADYPTHHDLARFSHPMGGPHSSHESVENWFLVDHDGYQHVINATPGAHRTVEAITQAVLKNIVQ